MKFDKTSILKHFVKSLKNKSLLPRPHLSIINTKNPEFNKSGLYTSSDKPSSQNIIGYDFIISKKGDDADTKTIFKCFIRSGFVKSSKEQSNEGFIPLTIEVDSNLDDLNSNIKIYNSDSGEEYLNEAMGLIKTIEEKKFFETEWSKKFSITYIQHSKENEVNEENSINLTITKNIEHLGADVYKIQFKLRNDTESIQKFINVREGEKLKPNSVGLGLLLEYSLKEECKNAKFKGELNRRNYKTSIKRLFNVVVQEESDKEILFQDFYIGSEIVPSLKKGKPIADFISELKKSDIHLSDEVGETFKKVWSFDKEPSFYKYQEDGIKKILEEMKNKSGTVNIISVRTAGGKTETFTVPLLDFCLKNIGKKGVKSLIFYPTKALANDQAARIFKALYYLNQIITKEDKRKISMGIYHGDIKNSPDDEKEVWIPFKCPKCDKLVTVKKEGINYFLQCEHCNEVFDFLYLTKYQIHKAIPDILITNQDTLTYRMMNNPLSHSIFGREARYCNKCGRSYLSQNRCSLCGEDLTSIKPECFPEVIIFDEIHMLKGAFGINTSLFIKRLINSINAYSKDQDYNPIYIGASATIKKPKEFTKKLFHIDKINIIPSESEMSNYYEEESEKNIRRDHLFILPTAYNSADTLSFGMKFVLETFKGLEDKPRVLGFNNSLKDCRDLITRTGYRTSGMGFIIKGHTSQFERDVRAKVEKEFSKGTVDVLYATSTLEVGVDFDEINVLLIHGAPYSFNDFLQRVGRSGRRKDAAVITTLRSWNPVDYFYFENCKATLENPMEYMESPPLSERNVVLLNNHIKSAFFDYLSSLPNTEKIVKISDLRKYLGGDTRKLIEERKGELRNFIKNCFDEEKLIDEFLEELEKLIFINLEAHIQTVDDLFEDFTKKYQIEKLRTSDLVVPVEFNI